MRLKDLKHIKESCPEEFFDCEVIYDNDWSDYEESGWVIVFKFFDELMVWDYEYSVMSSDNNVYFDPRPITEEGLLDLKNYWEASN